MNPLQLPTQHHLHPLWTVALATLLLAGSWLATPVYGPWLSNSVAATAVILTLLLTSRTPASSPLRLHWLLISITLGVAFAAVSWWLAPLASRLVPKAGHELQALYGTLGRAPGPIWGAPIIALSAMAEELVWRGILVDWCESRWSALRVVLASTISYAVPMAFSGSLLLVCVALALGAALTFERLRSGTWVTCFVTHLTWNVLVFVVHPVS